MLPCNRLDTHGMALGNVGNIFNESRGEDICISDKGHVLPGADVEV